MTRKKIFVLRLLLQISIDTFLFDFNGVTFYDNKPVFATIELDVCLTGFGGIFDNMVHHLPIPPKNSETTI